MKRYIQSSFEVSDMYSCVFKTKSKDSYLRMLRYIDSNGWRRTSVGDDWNCEFVIEFDMHE